MNATFKPGDHIERSDQEGVRGRVVAKRTTGGRLDLPGYVVELEDGRQAFVIADEAEATDAIVQAVEL